MKQQMLEAELKVKDELLGEIESKICELNSLIWQYKWSDRAEQRRKENSK